VRGDNEEDHGQLASGQVAACKETDGYPESLMRHLWGRRLQKCEISVDKLHTHGNI